MRFIPLLNAIFFAFIFISCASKAENNDIDKEATNQGNTGSWDSNGNLEIYQTFVVTKNYNSPQGKLVTASVANKNVRITDFFLVEDGKLTSAEFYQSEIGRKNITTLIYNLCDSNVDPLTLHIEPLHLDLQITWVQKQVQYVALIKPANEINRLMRVSCDIY